MDTTASPMRDEFDHRLPSDHPLADPSCLASPPGGDDAVIDGRCRPLAITDHPGRRAVLDRLLVSDGPQLVPRDGTQICTWRGHAFRLSKRHGRAFLALAVNGDRRHVALIGEPTEGTVRVRFERDVLCDEETLEAFAGCYGLTGAEEQVLLLLVQGQPPKRIAGLRTRSEATIRSQIRSVLSKTDSPSIRDLLMRLATLQNCLAPVRS